MTDNLLSTDRLIAYDLGADGELVVWLDRDGTAIRPYLEPEDHDYQTTLDACRTMGAAHDAP